MSQSAQVSIIIPTYNESQNIRQILRSIGEHIPKNVLAEAIVVDDNSPDGTGRIVEEYLKSVRELAHYTVSIIHRKAKEGLGAAILNGIEQARGETIVVMDSDFSHPPSLIPKMIEAIRERCDLVVASRYAKGGATEGWPLKRKIISRIATRIARGGLGIDIADPMSGFFAFKKSVINGLKFDTRGYKMLLEILAKRRDIRIHEIPYTFMDRRAGSSKLGPAVMADYITDVWRLYRQGSTIRERRASVSFLSKAARFFTVGASGLGVNYLASLLFADIVNMWYLHASLIGIALSITSNFVLNKAWTFGDRDFAPKKTAIQYAKFVLFSSAGALVQLGTVFYLVEQAGLSHPVSLVIAVMAAAFGNFVLNKRLTFMEKVWG